MYILYVCQINSKKGGESLPLAHSALFATPSNGAQTPPRNARL